MRARLAGALAGAVFVTAACGGVGYRLRTDAPPPASIAVLPFAGPAPVGVRDAARQLLHSRLRTRGYQVPELVWVDRVLSEHGWLRDPERFDPLAMSAADVAHALGVDAVLTGTDVDETSFQLVVLRRHAVGGDLAVHDANGREYWSASHAASTFGGFLLTSGQVFSELRAQGEHGTPMATLALIDELTADVAGTLPPAAPANAQRTDAPPPLAELTVAREPRADGGTRVRVQARSSAGATVRFELAPHAVGVPMVARPDAPERYVGAHDLPPGAPGEPGAVVVRARDAFGREATAEVVR